MKISPLDVCCAVAKEQNIPQVQAVVSVVYGVLLIVWDDMIDEAAQAVSQANQDEQGPERALFLSMVLWQALWRAPRREQLEFLRRAALRLGAGERASTAVEDVLLMLRGRFQNEASAIDAAITKPGATPAGLRDMFARIFGDGGHKVVHAVADTWAYRWHWVGQMLDVRRRGVLNFRYTNPLTPTTTPFCRWLVESGRILSIGKMVDQINKLERAIVENDIEIAKKAWPLLQFDGSETPVDFAEMFVGNSLGVPPFHFGCRTGIESI